MANRYEWKGKIVQEKDAGTIVVCDRYLASSIAYGEAQGLDVAWLTEIQKYLPQPDITFLLDIPPEVSARRKTEDRDKLRARPVAARARARKLSTSGIEDRLDAARRRSRARGRRGRRMAGHRRAGLERV